MLEKPTLLGAWFAVEMWMDVGPEKLPSSWKDELLRYGVGEIVKSERIALTPLGCRIEDKLLQVRCGSSKGAAP